MIEGAGAGVARDSLVFLRWRNSAGYAPNCGDVLRMLYLQGDATNEAVLEHEPKSILSFRILATPQQQNSQYIVSYTSWGIDPSPWEQANHVDSSTLKERTRGHLLNGQQYHLKNDA